MSKSNEDKKETLYDYLGIDRISTREDIKKAYRKKSLQYHPDVNKEPDAQEKYKNICKAYMILYDDTSRYKYDQTGEEERPMDRKPIEYEKLAKSILYRMVFALIDKTGMNITKKNLQKYLKDTLKDMVIEINKKLTNNRYLRLAAKEKIAAVELKKTKVMSDCLLYEVLETKIKHIKTQELLPLQEERRQCLIDKKTLRVVADLIEKQCIDLTKDTFVDPMQTWDQQMGWGNTAI